MPEPRTKTAAYESFSAIVREPMGSDVFDVGAVLAALPPEGKRADRRRGQFAAAIIQTTETEGFTVLWPDLNATDEQICTAYDYWRQLPQQFLIRWANAIFDVSQKGSDVDLLPKAAGE